MDKVTKILNIIWYGVKIVLHLTDKKDKVAKMDEVEEKLKK